MIIILKFSIMLKNQVNKKNQKLISTLTIKITPTIAMNQTVAQKIGNDYGMSKKKAAYIFLLIILNYT